MTGGCRLWTVAANDITHCSFYDLALTISKNRSLAASGIWQGRLTLYILHTLIQNALQDFRVFQLLLDLTDDAVGQLPLLSGLNLPFIPHPGVENTLGLCSQSGLLLHLVCLSLESRGFLIRGLGFAILPCIQGYQIAIRTFDTSNRFFVMSITPPKSFTLSILDFTASVWSCLAAFKMP